MTSHSVSFGGCRIEELLLVFFEIINKSAAFMAKLEESKIFPKDDEIFPFFEEVQSLSRIL